MTQFFWSCHYPIQLHIKKSNPRIFFCSDPPLGARWENHVFLWPQSKTTKNPIHWSYEHIYFPQKMVRFEKHAHKCPIQKSCHKCLAEGIKSTTGFKWAEIWFVCMLRLQPREIPEFLGWRGEKLWKNAQPDTRWEEELFNKPNIIRNTTKKLKWETKTRTPHAPPIVGCKAHCWGRLIKWGQQ